MSEELKGDFWRDSGYHLLEKDAASGHLRITDDFLRAYFRRPEVSPVAESCAAEIALHQSLIANPREAVAQDRLARLADPDARENYQVVLDFRDRLVRAGTVEEAYMTALGEAGGVRIPPLFVDQMVHVILRGILEGTGDALRARAGEMLFRDQKVTISDGHIMAADAEVVEMYATTGGFGSLGQLVVEAQTPLRQIELDVLDETNAARYWARDRDHDTVLNLDFAGPGLDALCRVLEAWVRHFLETPIRIQPVQEIRDERWSWHVGLEAEGTALLNDLYNGQEVGEARLARLLSLFRLEFEEPSVMLPKLAGRPVYLAMCMTEAGSLRLKPQNLLFNLPIAAPS